MLPSRASQDRDDSVAGLRFLAYGLYGNPGLNKEIFENLWRVWDGDDAKKAQGATSAQIRKLALARYGLMEAPYENNGVPLGYTKGENGVWYSNCLLCHAGAVKGKPMLGAPNNRVDLATLSEDFDLLMSFVRGLPIRRPVTLPMQMNTSKGVTNAVIFSHNLLRVRDRDLDLMESIVDLGPIIDHDLDAPPWWNVKYKDRLYMDSFVPKGPRALMQFAMNPHNDGRTLRRMLPGFTNALSYIDHIEVPKYEGEIDRTLAATGRMAFEARCASCHGTYGATPKYPQKLVPIASIKTDSLRLEGLTDKFRTYYQDSWLGDYGRSDVSVEGLGYVAPPLYGIWASAPYLHNGSVPTLYHVLHPDERPKVWRVRDYDAFDDIKVGLVVDVFEEAPTEGLSASDQRRFYDTSVPGKSNQGHNYPSLLSESEKMAVLEYLKTL